MDKYDKNTLILVKITHFLLMWRPKMGQNGPKLSKKCVKN